MKPGNRYRPVTSMTTSLVSTSNVPTVSMTSPRIARSAFLGLPPEPSKIVPPRRTVRNSGIVGRHTLRRHNLPCHGEVASEHAALDGQHDSRNPRGGIGCKEHERLGDVGWKPNAPQGIPPGGLLEHQRVLLYAMFPVLGCHRPGGYRVAPDTVATELHRDRLGEALQPGLRRGVRLVTDV